METMMYDVLNERLYRFPCTIRDVYYHSEQSADADYLLERGLRLATDEEVQAYYNSLPEPVVPSNQELRKRFYENEIVDTLIGSVTLDYYLTVILAYDVEGTDTSEMKAEYLSLKESVRALYPDEV
jgi:hypothetical protein